MSRKIFLDCTNTYNSGLNTGIQRVVKNIVKNIQTISSDLNIDIVPIVYYKKEYRPFFEFPQVKMDSNQNRIKIILKRVYKSIRNIFSIVPPIKKLMLNPEFILFFNKLFDSIYQKKLYVDTKKVEFQKDDILLLLDSTWSDVNFSYLKDLKNKDVKIITVVYDLIPLTNSEYCSEDLVSVFNFWLKNITPITDKFITISKSVQDDLEILNKIDKNKIDYFYLGSDFKANSYDENKLDNSFKNIFKENNTYITVSTVEPRKNHQYILSAFEKLWEKNIDVKYIIIGRIGWKIEKLVEKIKNHKEFNKRLFLLNNVDDAHLFYAYKHSKALIFASYIEGFGLPIIESLYNNLQVLGSDIKIHREIGGNNISYFDLDSVDSLVNLIETNNFNKNISEFKWLSWEDSARQLINKALEDN